MWRGRVITYNDIFEKEWERDALQRKWKPKRWRQKVSFMPRKRRNFNLYQSGGRLRNLSKYLDVAYSNSARRLWTRSTFCEVADRKRALPLRTLKVICRRWTRFRRVWMRFLKVRLTIRCNARTTTRMWFRRGSTL